MKKILFSIIFICLTFSQLFSQEATPEDSTAAAEEALQTSIIEAEVRELTRSSIQLVIYLGQIISLHEGGMPVRLTAPIDSLSVDFGTAQPTKKNRKELRKKFRLCARIIKAKMNELLTLVK